MRANYAKIFFLNSMRSYINDNTLEPVLKMYIIDSNI